MTQISKFCYLGSFDELTWTNIGTDLLANRCQISWSDRKEVRIWIETCCKSTVYCWNGTSSPEAGQSIRCLTPDAERCYLIFTDPTDNELFLLRYADAFLVKHFGKNIERILQDSKKI